MAADVYVVVFQEVIDALMHRNLQDNDEVPPDPDNAPPEVAKLLRQRAAAGPALDEREPEARPGA